MPDTLEKVFEQETFEKGLGEIYHAAGRIKERINARMQLGLTSCDGPNRTVTMHFTVQEWQLNVNNTLHGGIIMTAFDMAMGIFANYLGYSQGKAAATVNMIVHFLKPVALGETLRLTATVTSTGRRMVFLSGEAYSERTQKLVGTASSTFFLIDRPADSQLNHTGE